MKKLGALALLLSLSVFAIGCEKPKETAPADTSTDTTTETPAETPAE